MDFATQKLLATSLLGFNGGFPQPALPFTRFSGPLPVCRKASLAVNAKRRDAYAQQLAKKNQQNQIEEEEEFDDDEEEDYEENFDDGGEEEEEFDEEETSNYLDEDILLDAEEYVDELEEEIEVGQQNVYVGDGGDGGGISVGTRQWEKEALSIAEQVSQNSFNGDVKIYAFKTSPMFHIYVRIEKLSTKYGSPCLSDIEAFSIAYREKLDEAESDGRIPNNTYLEVSSPGAERVVQIPEELERFKDKPMYVKYISDDAGPPKENDGILKLISYDLELGNCIWGIADVKANKPGKGRPLNKKQKEWRLNTDFECLKLVKLHLDC